MCLFLQVFLVTFFNCTYQLRIEIKYTCIGYIIVQFVCGYITCKVHVVPIWLPIPFVLRSTPPHPTHTHRAREKSKQTDGTPLALFNMFIDRVREQLHVVLAMSPIGDAFRTRLRMFPSLVNCCTIDWFQVQTSIQQFMLHACTLYMHVSTNSGSLQFVCDERKYCRLRVNACQ